MRLEALVPTLQIAIGPAILISGAGLLLLSMTNRLGRTIDRIRGLLREFASANGNTSVVTAQLEILRRRARLIRGAIAASSVSILLDAILVIVLFIGAVMQISVTAPVVATLFVACMGSLIISLLLFIADVNVSLRALRLEIAATLG